MAKKAFGGKWLKVKVKIVVIGVWGKRKGLLEWSAKLLQVWASVLGAALRSAQMMFSFLP